MSLQKSKRSIEVRNERPEDYYLMDGTEEKALLLKTESRIIDSENRRKTVAIWHKSNATSGWEYFASGTERECRLVPDAGQSNLTFGKNEASFYLYDHLGNTRVNYTPTGFTSHPSDPVAVNRINTVVDYFPYGKVLREFVNGEQERYLTTQHERDEETGLDYRGARYYDGDVGRFLSLDPLAAEFPKWSDYTYVFDNPLSFTDPDGKSGEPVYDDENMTVTVKVHFVFYGGQATKDNAQKVMNNTQKNWESANATVVKNDKSYRVNFLMTYNLYSFDEAKQIAKTNTSGRINFVRLEDGGDEASRTARKFGVVGSNSFWINTNELDDKTPTHELGHGFGLPHPSETLNYSNETVPPHIMFPKGQQYAEEWGVDSGKGYFTVDPKKRIVTQENVQEASDKNWGEITNILFNKDGTYYESKDD